MKKLTPPQQQINDSFLNSAKYHAFSENGYLYRDCVIAANAGRIEQVKELIRHFDKVGNYAEACRFYVSQWLELNQ